MSASVSSVSTVRSSVNAFSFYRGAAPEYHFDLSGRRTLPVGN